MYFSEKILDFGLGFDFQVCVFIAVLTCPVYMNNEDRRMHSDTNTKKIKRCIQVHSLLFYARRGTLTLQSYQSLILRAEVSYERGSWYDSSIKVAIPIECKH